MRAVLESAPEVVEHISRVLAERQTALDGHVASQSAPATVQERSSLLLGRIRKFFSLRVS